MKICRDCLQEKSLSDFRLYDKKRLYYRAECRDCENAWKRKYRRLNPEKDREYNRKKYYYDVEKSRERVKTYYRENREKCSESYKKRRAEDPERFK